MGDGADEAYDLAMRDQHESIMRGRTNHDIVHDAEFTTTEESVTALAVRATSAPMQTWTPSFAVQVDEAIARKKEKARFFHEVMDEDKHYGKIPGAGDKPALLKPGAEMLLANMGLVAEFEDEDPPIVDLEGLSEHSGEAYVHYRRRCVIYRQTGPTENERMRVAKASGSCSSREKKYRWRDSQRTCPECGKTTIIVGKAEYGGGFLCFKKKGGCGAKFAANDPRILEQASGQIPNPDIADVENTILKMADKRALVAATLIATGCSDIFTQDIEDQAPHDDPPSPRGVAPQSQPKPAAQPPPTPDAEYARTAFEAAKRLGHVPDDKVIFREYMGEKFPGMPWSARAAALASEEAASSVPRDEMSDIMDMVDEELAAEKTARLTGELQTESTHRKLEKRVLAICTERRITTERRHELAVRLYAKKSLTELNEAQLAEFGDLLERGEAA